MEWTVGNLAGRLGGTVEGDVAARVTGMAGLVEAGDGDVSFLANPRYAPLVAETRATAVVVSRDYSGAWSSRALIRVDNADRAFAAIAPLLGPAPCERLPGVHATAIVAPDARLGADVHIGPWCVIESGARIGDRTTIEAQCFVGRETAIGCDSHLYPQVAIRERVRIGARFIAHCGTVIGSDGFGYLVEPRPGALPLIEKIPQIGTVVIGDDVELGANVTIDRARFGETRIGNHVKIDNLVQIGHNVRIGDCSGIVAQAGVAGSSQVGAGVMIWAQGGVAGHLKIGDGAQVGPQAGVAKDVPAGEYVIGTPAVRLREFVALAAAARQIEKLKTRLVKLEARLEAASGATE
ncbi:MAG: UDP-3-O-(3-hydroxymyristoyl)glucosamine N-acyltransferase [Kiritimatiellae bacterium]|nr:UDP-3-O-(3-hydroxymyristoyl)glucosamine N-acyltransferase [Kiritimatiellia bacterium]